MSARDRLAAMVRTDAGSLTVWSVAEVHTALDDYRAEVLAAHGITGEKDTRGLQPQQGESTPEPPRPHALPEASFVRARACERIGGFFRCARIGHAETAGAQ
ncbi:hypothetical protein [Streptomyces sp. NPDC006527]|uniref:hypothetical protein n=1 Tax=Streptomyces sp. NPDC006527 TaxID=3364749 RepID=UPI0036CC4011